MTRTLHKFAVKKIWAYLTILRWGRYSQRYHMEYTGGAGFAQTVGGPTKYLSMVFLRRGLIITKKHGRFSAWDLECGLRTVEKPSVTIRFGFRIHGAYQVDAIFLFLNGGRDARGFVIDGNAKTLAENEKKWRFLEAKVGQKGVWKNARRFLDRSRRIN